MLFVMNYAEVPFPNYAEVLKVHVCALFGTHRDVVDMFLFFLYIEAKILCRINVTECTIRWTEKLI